MSSQPTTPGDFFVGYLPIPGSLRHWLIGMTGIALLVVVALAVSMAIGQRDPGTGVWQLYDESTATGVLLAEPYPMLLTAETNGRPRTILLVGAGKYGVADRAADLHGKPVRIKGHLIARDSRHMFELADEPESIEPLDASNQNMPTNVAAETSSHPTRLRGEIVDPKCYLGAMKPGEGKTHKACATLCIRGGIPPAFYSVDPTGRRECYLLVGPSGEALHGESLECVLPYVADLVELEGAVQTRADLKLLRLDLGTIQRL
jgi:hypothetical protein